MGKGAKYYGKKERAASYGASGTLDVGFDSQRNGEPLEDSEQGHERLDLVSIGITLAARLRKDLVGRQGQGEITWTG